MQQYHERARACRGVCGLSRWAGDIMLGRFGLDDVEPDPVRMHLGMAPRPVDTDDRRRRCWHYQPDGSGRGREERDRSDAPGPVAAGVLLSWEVNTSRVSLTDSIVWRGPRMRRTFR